MSRIKWSRERQRSRKGAQGVLAIHTGMPITKGQHKKRRVWLAKRAAARAERNRPLTRQFSAPDGISLSEIMFSHKPGEPWSVYYRRSFIAGGFDTQSDCWAFVETMKPDEDPEDDEYAEPDLAVLMGERMA